MEPRNEVKLNDEVRYIGSTRTDVPQETGSVIWVWLDLLEEYGDPVTHLVWFDQGNDFETGLFWFNPVTELEVVTD